MNEVVCKSCGSMIDETLIDCCGECGADICPDCETLAINPQNNCEVLVCGACKDDFDLYSGARYNG